MRLGKKFTAAATAGIVALAAPAAASAATTPVATSTPATTVSPILLTFVPPKVGPISVDLGATIINGQMVSPGVHVLMPGVTIAPMTWTWPRRS
jgi:hypothetical protein